MIGRKWKFKSNPMGLFLRLIVRIHHHPMFEVKSSSQSHVQFLFHNMNENREEKEGVVVAVGVEGCVAELGVDLGLAVLPIEPNG